MLANNSRFIKNIDTDTVTEDENSSWKALKGNNKNLNIKPSFIFNRDLSSPFERESKDHSHYSSSSIIRKAGEYKKTSVNLVFNK